MDMSDRQAAIDLLDNLIGMVDDNHGSDYDAALRMGIEALKAEEPEDTIEMQESDIDKAMKLVRDARVTIQLSAEPETCAYWDRESNLCALHRPSAEPEISRIEKELHGKTPEEQYAFIDWLLCKFALAYTDSRLAVVEWLRGEK